MQEALKGKPSIPFRIPPGTSFVRVNAQTGLRAKANDPNAIMEAFKPGTEDGIKTTNDPFTDTPRNENSGEAPSEGLY